jgi:hypothetical protein
LFTIKCTWSIRQALEAAYEAGRQSCKPVPPKARAKGGKAIVQAIKSDDKSTT